MVVDTQFNFSSYYLFYSVKTYQQKWRCFKKLKLTPSFYYGSDIIKNQQIKITLKKTNRFVFISRTKLSGNSNLVETKLSPKSNFGWNQYKGGWMRWKPKLRARHIWLEKWLRQGLKLTTTKIIAKHVWSTQKMPEKKVMNFKINDCKCFTFVCTIFWHYLVTINALLYREN